MKLRPLIFVFVPGLLFTGAALAAPPARKQQSDLSTVEQRRTILGTAQKLARIEAPAPLPEDLPQPFNPSGFNSTAREEPKTAGAPVARQHGDRDILEAIAAYVVPSGTFGMEGQRYLQFSKKRLKVGDKLTVTHDGDDYTLELTAIDATTFTLRLNREEITRPIKPGK